MAKRINLKPGEPLPELTVAVIDELKAKGLTQSDIARMFGVTRQAVSWHKQNYNGKKTPREVVLSNFPWEVSGNQQRCSAHRRLRDHGEYMATGGEGMNEDKLTRLRGFYKKLRNENVVVEYDPNIPSEPGVSFYGGFAYRKRRSEDGDLLIRVNEYTNLTPEGRLIWVFPPRVP